MAQVSIGKWGLTFHQEVMDTTKNDKNEQSGDTSLPSSLLVLISYTIIVKLPSKTYPLSPVSFISVIACVRGWSLDQKLYPWYSPLGWPYSVSRQHRPMCFLEGESASLHRLVPLRFKDSLKLCIFPSVIDHQIKQIRFLTCKVFAFNPSQWFHWRSLTVSKRELLTFLTAPTEVQEKICKKSTTLWRWNLIVHWSW